MLSISANLLHQFPASHPENVQVEIRTLLQQKNAVVVVLDDDPTGAQFAGVPLLTDWHTQTIRNEVQAGSTLFYILTNSRSLPAAEAVRINTEAGKNIQAAFRECGKQYILISRSDSTLRGHYPDEVLALANGVGMTDFHTALIPAFFEAGRFTVNDIQYVQEGEQLIPVHCTPFAQDKAFGYQARNLWEWVIEKTRGAVAPATIFSFSVEELRLHAVPELVRKLQSLPSRGTLIVNAVAQSDLEKFALACLRADINVIFRTGPSFVAAIGALSHQRIISAKEIVDPDSAYGGLVVVGSYVPKTTHQLEYLLQQPIQSVELDVNQIITGDSTAFLNECLHKIGALLRQKKDVAVYTSRQLVHGHSADENLQIGNRISAFLVQLVKQLPVQPRFLVSKGGITSHDIAVKALGIKRARVKGQLLSGIPVWQTGSECRFPFIPYIVFPGNVGDERTLAQLYEKLNALE